MADPAVEWSLVDYGGGNFYVASYRRPEEAAAKPAMQVEEQAEEPGCRWSNCIPMFRCWTSSRQARKAA